MIKDSFDALEYKIGIMCEHEIISYRLINNRTGNFKNASIVFPIFVEL